MIPEVLGRLVALPSKSNILCLVQVRFTKHVRPYLESSRSSHKERVYRWAHLGPHAVATNHCRQLRLANEFHWGHSESTQQASPSVKHAHCSD